MTSDAVPGLAALRVPIRAPALDGVRMVGFRSAAAFSKRILPWPRYGIVLNCSTSAFRSAGLPERASGVVGGMAPEPAEIGGTAVDCIEVQLSPLVVAAVLDVPPAELNAPMTTLDDLWGAEAERLRARMLELPDWDDRFAAVGDHLAARYRERHRVDGEIADAWRRIRRTGGQVSVSGLARDYGWSRTRFWSRFTCQVGVSPKRAARIVRFDRALRLIGADRDLAAVAADCGYADQSHLHRDFLDFAATTPGALRDDPQWTGDPAWVLDGPLP